MPIIRGLVLLSLASQDTTRIRVLLDVEDSRPRSIEALAPLIEAARSGDTLVARWAIRGLGRQQRGDLLPALSAALASTSPGNRAEAANAIAQSTLHDDTDPGPGRRALETRLTVESDPVVISAILRALGRLREGPVEWTGLELLITRSATGVEGDASRAVLEGAAQGLGSLYRQRGAQPASTASVERLAALTGTSYPPTVRRPAMAALVASARADSTVLHRGLKDSAREVRRAAATAAFISKDLPGRERLVDVAWRDADPAVRYEAVRAFGRHLVKQETCEPILGALDDKNLHVRLLAVDLLGACGNGAAPRLVNFARSRLTADAWHLPAHAIVALANADSGAALALLPRFVSSGVWWARMYAARAAETLGEIPALTRLARDQEPNVREAALAGLHRKVGHQADSLYIAALGAGDYQLIQTAATALDSSADPRAVPALWKAFARLTSEKRETSRDPRMAILRSIEHIGSQSLATELREAASDFDSTVAQAAARLASKWSATSVAPTPKPLPRAPVPSWSDLDRWSRVTAEITMRNGGVIRMKLRPFDAPTNVARFVNMVNRGWFDGLTWHRVVPNFVVQGGSPGANEFMGDGPFTRDELGLEHHVRGTVGISTRGRDTGDGQIFFNLIDNWRLDHDYTIIGEVVSGMEVVDAMQEGALIQRVTLIPDKS
ncbi:MAG TPA: HEAT repeat domain-containing protein [Gemmatimonadales bacterium]|nr:HEAT repeat domain-containing protein [Gemmatimonadales bacterium]